MLAVTNHMPDRYSRSSVELDVTAGEQPSRAVEEEDTPFRILLAGDFSGRANRGLPAHIAGRRPRMVDSDNLDEVMAAMDVGLQLPQGALRFRGLDDFHPDHLYAQAGVFRQLAEARTKPPAAPAPPPPPRAASAKSDREMGRDLLESMLASEEETAARAAAEPDGLADFIEKVMTPHLAEREDPRRVEWAAKVDQTAGEQMRAVLHHPDFQALEAIWSSAARLVRQLQPDTDLKIYLLDATLEELTAEGGAPAFAGDWAVIAGHFTFGQGGEDAARLGVLGGMAAKGRAPFLAEALPPEEAEPGPAWQALARSAEARWIGLALPRILLRLPYGKSTSAIESFEFEEMPESVHQHYLWGNPGFFCAGLLGEAFRDGGWDLRPERHRQIGGLPVHVYRADGQSVSKPCAEIAMRESDAEFLVDNGLMPMASVRDSDSVLLVRWQSIAVPAARLAGRWS
jgi:type VI secretion system protein ImpC